MHGMKSSWRASVLLDEHIVSWPERVCSWLLGGVEGHGPDSFQQDRNESGSTKSVTAFGWWNQYSAIEIGCADTIAGEVTAGSKVQSLSRLFGPASFVRTTG